MKKLVMINSDATFDCNEIGKDFFLQRFPDLSTYNCNCFAYELSLRFQDVIIKADLKYRPGAYVIFDFSNDIIGECLYVGESGFKNGRIVDQQLPVRILNATCHLPPLYPDCNNKRSLKRSEAWLHMMMHDKISKILFVIIYSPLVEENGKLICKPKPVELQNQIIKALKSKGNLVFRWSLSN